MKKLLKLVVRMIEKDIIRDYGNDYYKQSESWMELEQAKTELEIE